jgi:hypothetical protein
MSPYGKERSRSSHSLSFSDEPKAEEECEKSLMEALKIDPDNIDAL